MADVNLINADENPVEICATMSYKGCRAAYMTNTEENV